MPPIDDHTLGGHANEGSPGTSHNRVLIHNSTFHIKQNELPGSSTSTEFETLCRHVCVSALDVAGDFDLLMGHKNAAMMMLNDWVSTVGQRSDGRKPICWLSSTSEGHIIPDMDVFFKGTHEKPTARFTFGKSDSAQSDPNSLIPTIAYQLSIAIPDLRMFVEDGIRRDPLVFKRNLRHQTNILLVEPFQRMKAAAASVNSLHDTPCIIIVDGLNHCGNSLHYHQRIAAQLRVLEGLRNLSLIENTIPVSILVSSTEDPHIQQYFESSNVLQTTLHISLDGPTRHSQGEEVPHQTLDSLMSAVATDAYTTPSRSYLRTKDQEERLFTSIRALRDAQADAWSILWVNNGIDPVTQQRTTDLLQILSRGLTSENLLAATFSCSSPLWNPEKNLIPTLAYQLAKSRPGTLSHMNAALVARPSLLDQRPSVQFEYLITRPLVKDFQLGSYLPLGLSSDQYAHYRPPSYFILDAFHHCGSTAFQTEILDSISHLTSMYTGPPLTFIIGSSVTETLSVDFFTHPHLRLQTKSLIVDSSPDDSTILAGASVDPTPLLLRQAYSPVGQDHFYTADADEFARAQHIAYQPLEPSHNPYRIKLYNAIGGVYSTSVPFSIPLFRLFNIGNGDHHYTTDIREINTAVKLGYQLECIAGFVLEKHGQPEMVNVSMGVGVGDEVVRFQGDAMRKPWELKRMWSGVRRDHVYLTWDNAGQDKLILQGYDDEGVIGRLVPLF